MYNFFLIPWQFYKNYTTILSSHPQHTILVLVLSLSHHKGVHRGGGGDMKKWGGGLGEETKLEEGLRVKWGKGKGGGGYFQTHLLQDMKTDITGASDGVLVSLTSVPISIEISPTFTASLKNRLFLAFFISVCVCVFPDLDQFLISQHICV